MVSVFGPGTKQQTRGKAAQPGNHSRSTIQKQEKQHKCHEDIDKHTMHEQMGQKDSNEKCNALQTDEATSVIISSAVPWSQANATPQKNSTFVNGVT
mmetsp:Transcript_47435/g.113932  ORF Transcript_47435/g.113932 Transcript_47435/m.113932 type:complete len:97 (-) Transcript_47435:71-361(-)|eukprot:CAMPEP_0169438996 /NCGR_PEP_ID=MMETSP1042-20121227/6972_1 /TAXON_ID=464988 /ORGANISM="Hemiselmis andersenii, Strain CCMP1180" /LENGTH=96 /DNA_ID=CAMNT_0009549899 /DNA_START=793 /DNA_END=1083 /DNA_ORIENTATION=-